MMMITRKTQVCNDIQYAINDDDDDVNDDSDDQDTMQNNYGCS